MVLSSVTMVMMQLVDEIEFDTADPGSAEDSEQQEEIRETSWGELAFPAHPLTNMLPYRVHTSIKSMKHVTCSLL